VYTRLYDSTNPAAREFLWKQLNASFFSNGIHNFWIDQADGGILGEPFENNGQSIVAIPYERAHTQYFSGSQEATGKAYPWLHQQAIDEGLQNMTGSTQNSTHQTSCQFMSLARSTFLGGQRFCSYLWSGDTTATFPTLTQQITAGVSAGGSGLSSWTLDLGGFSGLNINDTNDQELFVRWFSMGTFLPYMRVHGDRQCSIPPNTTIPFGNNCPNEPWAFDNTGDAHFLILNSYINLRYQIMPYTKRVFQLLHNTGRTIMRGLYYDFSVSDPFVVNATAVNDPLVVFQFMFGPRILVAPVAELGATSKTVYLPKLTDSMIAQNFTWTHWWSNATFGTGGMSINISAPLSQIPLFYLGTQDDIFAGNV